MKLERIALEPIAYSLRAPLVTSSATLSQRSGFRVRAHDTGGREGLGEALPLPSAGCEAPELCERALREAAELLPRHDASLDELLDLCELRWPFAPAARCALDIALHDLEARRRGVPLAALLVAAPRQTVACNAVISANDPGATLAAARLALQRGYRTLKLKLGSDLDAELERVALLRALVGTQVRIRLDANGSWTRERAARFLARLIPHDVELVEQPLAAADLEGLRSLHASSPVPIAADESLALPEGRQALLQGTLTDFAVLKPMVLGGLRAGVRLAQDARRASVRSFVTTTLDGPIAGAAALHLAAAIGDATLASGLAAADHLSVAFPDWLVPRAGVLQLCDAPGLGPDLAP